MGKFLGEYELIREDPDTPGRWITEVEYGLCAFHPIARGYDYSHYDDFGDGRSYGYRRSHTGNDLMGAIGTPVVAVESGIIEVMGWNQYCLLYTSPDDPLAIGMADAIRRAGIRAFGPSKLAAEIESSKVFAKQLMRKYGIPTARYEVFSEAERAIEYVQHWEKFPVVIKADGCLLYTSRCV